MHPIANRTIYRMKELIHQFSILRRNFYYEEFQKVSTRVSGKWVAEGTSDRCLAYSNPDKFQIVRNVLFGEWADGMTVKAKLPPKFVTLTSLFIKTWPELHAQELIGVGHSNEAYIVQYRRQFWGNITSPLWKWSKDFAAAIYLPYSWSTFQITSHRLLLKDILVKIDTFMFPKFWNS